MSAEGGSEDAFADMMNAQAQRLGMRSTSFRNASGLPNPLQKTTARDLTILARALVQTYPGYYHYFSDDSFVWRSRTYLGHNRLLRSYQGADGLKTGYIRASGFNLATSAVRNGHRVIGVVLGGRSAGARVACRTAVTTGAAGVLCLAFPLHPPGRPEKTRADELAGAGVPVHVVQGRRDPFGGPEEVTALGLAGVVVAAVDGDHGLRASARPEGAVAAAVAAALATVAT